MNTTASPSDLRPGWTPSPWVWILGCFLLSRLLLHLVGLYARWGWEGFMEDHYQWYLHPSAWLDMWAVWDSGWYMHIVEHGYARELIWQQPDGTPMQLNLAFFPLYPLLMWLMKQATGHVVVAGYLISNGCLLAACRLLYLLGRERWGEAEARLAVAILCFMPHSFVFSSVYTESLFLMLLLATVLAAHRGCWFWAGVLGALLASTRLVGVTVGLGLLWLFWEQRAAAGRRGWTLHREDARVLWLGLIPLGIVAFAVYLHFHNGDAMSFMKAQQGWYRSWHVPFEALWRGLVFHEDQENIYTSLATVALAGLGLCLLAMRRWMEALIALPLMLVPMLSGPGDLPFASMPRYFIVVFPLAGVMARIGTQAPQFGRLCFLAMCTWNGFLMTAWATGLHITI